MYNDWFKIGPLTVHGYGFMIAVGILAAIWMAEKLTRERGLDSERIETMILFSLAVGYACSKLLYTITVFDEFLKNPLSVLGSGGWVVYGGLIGGAAGAWIWCRRHGWDFMDYMNTLVVSIALAQGFGRIGCFFAGCCYGIETNSAIGMTFPKDSLCPVGHPVIPTQLIMSAGDFLIFAFLYRNLRKGKHPENNAAYYLILYSFGRFMIEFIRGDVSRGHVGFLSTSQFIAVFVFLAGLWLLYDRKNRQTAKDII